MVDLKRAIEAEKENVEKTLDDLALAMERQDRSVVHGYGFMLKEKQLLNLANNIKMSGRVL